MTDMPKRKKKLVSYNVGKMDSIDYEEKYGDMLIEHMAEGRSYATFRSIVGVSTKTYGGWEKIPHFKECKELAFLASMDKWEDIALRQANGEIKGSASALIFTMKNRFKDHYKDKQEVEHQGNIVWQINSGIPNADEIDLEDDNIIENTDYKVIEETKEDSELL